jgi:hypothetical protein
LGSRKSPHPSETVVTEKSPEAPPSRPTIEQRRQRILEGLERLDDEGILRVDWFIKAILEDDPVLMSLASAPEDDEPETEEERRAVAEAMKEVEAGLSIPHEEARRQLLGES